LKVNGGSVLTAEDVVAAVRGQTVSVEISRDGTNKEIDIPLKNGKIGVVVSNYYSGQPLVNTFTAEVGGASAGLAMTLAFIDSLTPGDLTNGDHLAATGVIMPDGSVGMVDGVQYKAQGAARDGATLLLVPKGNKESVKSPALPLHEVSTIEEAVDFLCDRGSDDAICEMENS
jgi:PDZ domain-containing protein